MYCSSSVNLHTRQFICLNPTIFRFQNSSSNNKVKTKIKKQINEFRK